MRYIILLSIVFVILVSGCVSDNIQNNGRNQTQQTPQENLAIKYEDSSFGVAISSWASDYLTRFREDLLGTGSHWAGSHLVRWKDIEPEKGEFDWDEIDYYLDKAGNDINLLLELRLYTDWANVGGCEYHLAGSPVTDWDALDNFLRALVNRVKDKVKYYSIENEVEFPSFWCCTYCTSEEESAEEYIKILKFSYEVIKEEQPEAKILISGFTGNWKDGTNTNPEFVEYLLKNSKDYYDILDVHLYGEIDDYKEKIEWFKGLMDYSKPIWSTEMGGPDMRNCKDISEADRALGDVEIIISNSECAKVFHLPEFKKEYYKMHAEEVVKRYVTIIDAGVSKAFWWTIYSNKEYDFRHSSYAFQKMGLVAREAGERGQGYIDYWKTPGYYTYKIMVSELDLWDSMEKIGENSYLFSVDGEKVIVAWDGNFDFSDHFTGKVRVRHIVVDYDSNNDPVYIEDSIVDSDSLAIESPVFIRKV